MSTRMIAGVTPGEIQAFSAGIGTYAGTRLVTLADGVERGVRVVEMRSGGGLDFDVTVDRGGDIGRLAANGQTLSWHATGGLSAPWLIDREGDNGQGFLRGFGGFLNTCGLDHIRQPERDIAEKVNHDGLEQIDFPLHGKGTFHPAVLRGHGLVDDVPEPYVFCETEFVQSMSFVSALRLRRRIEVPIGSKSIVIRDVVRNVGSNPVTHMLLYHFNIGFPLVSPGTIVSFGDDHCTWRSKLHDPSAPFGSPEASAGNFLSLYEHTNETARVSVSSAKAGIRMDLEYPSAQLPYCQMLQMAEPGIFGMGIEPCTNAARSRAQARQNGEMIVLQKGDERRYDLTIDLTNTEIRSE